MGVLDLLLKPELFQDIEVVKAGVILLPTVSLVLKSKARAHYKFLQLKGNIDSRVPGSALHST